MHRAENVDDPERLKNITDALLEVVENLDTTIVFPAHPRTVKNLKNMVYMINLKIQVVSRLQSQ